MANGIIRFYLEAINVMVTDIWGKPIPALIIPPAPGLSPFFKGRGSVVWGEGLLDNWAGRESAPIIYFYTLLKLGAKGTTCGFPRPV